MKYAVISDVHANLDALLAVLKDIREKKIKKNIFLGDAVGYGPEPDECVDVLKTECSVMLAGNHDWAVLGLTEIEHFNPIAKEAILWAMEKISRETISILKTLSISKEIEDKKILLVHSTPKEPEKWHYLLTLWDAEINFHCFDNRICLLGHSHYPLIIERLPSGEMSTHRNSAKLSAENRYIVNVGSVGQPRDGDPRACYAIIDEEFVNIYRVQYDVEKTQGKMRSYGLPEPLIERLKRGL